MKTIVYQSFKADDVPSWLGRCLDSVMQWSRNNGFDYVREDNFYDYVPDWYVKKAQNKINVIADLARLKLARKYLDQGYERVIWMDADVIIFNPENLTIETTESHLLCNEVWLDTADNVDFGAGEIFCASKITNSITMFTQDSKFLDFYIEATESIVKRNVGYLSKLCVSTNFFTPLSKIVYLPLFHQVGLFSPILMHGIVSDDQEILQSYVQSLGSPVYAANLCYSFRNKTYKGLSISDALFDETITKLLSTKGIAINQSLVS